MTGLKDCKRCQENVLPSLAKKKTGENMNRSFLINQVRSCMLPYTSQIVEEASFFSVTVLDVLCTFNLPHVSRGFIVHAHNCYKKMKPN